MSRSAAEPGLWSEVARLIRAEAALLLSLVLGLTVARLMLPLGGLLMPVVMGAWLLLGWRLYWRALLPDQAPHRFLTPPAWPFLAFVIRVMLAIGVWVMLFGALMALGLLIASQAGPDEDLLALITVAIAAPVATYVTLALAAPGLPPPVVLAAGQQARPGLLAALRWRHLGARLGLLTVPILALALSGLVTLWFDSGPWGMWSGALAAVQILVSVAFTQAVRLLALVVTVVVLARIWRRIAPPPPSMAAVFA